MLPAAALLTAVVAVTVLASFGVRLAGRPTGGSPGPGGRPAAEAGTAGAPPAAAPARPQPPPDEIRGSRVRHLAVPILMYHVIAPVRRDAAYPGLFVSPARFAGQMRALERAGYRGVTLQRVWDAWHRGTPLPRRPVVVSFDDGFMGDYTRALPVLRSLGWPGVLNLKIDAMKDPGNLRPTHIRGLMKAGWEIDPHSITHPDLTTLGATQLQREVAGSRRRLRREFGIPADFFCYPSGRFDDRVVAAVRAAGYRAATTVEPGLATPEQPFTLPRLRVIDGDSGRTLLGKIAARAH